MASVEILAIGTELLLGQILNTNAQFLSDELAQIGMDCFWHTTVGDNVTRIKQCLKQALDRNDVVITTGGLGPTADDLTIECIAGLFNAPMILDEPTLAWIESLFAKRGLTMPQTNRKQAMRPQGSQILPNPAGTAPGIIWILGEKLLSKIGVSDPKRERIILTFPGVPREMKVMWQETAKQFLVRHFGISNIWSCDLKHYGIGESALAELCADLLDLPNPTVAPLAGQGECRLRVTAKAGTPGEARAIALPVIEQIKERTKYLCYGENEDSLESVVGRLLTEANFKLAVAESCTGGLVSKRLTDIAGSSNYTDLNIVTYANWAKEEMLGVPREVLEKHGAVSAECAEAMAKGIRNVSRAHIGLSVTGVAGPGASGAKPAGLVYIGLAATDFYVGKVLNHAPDITRLEIRHRSASYALNMVRLFLLDKKIL